MTEPSEQPRFPNFAGKHAGDSIVSPPASIRHTSGDEAAPQVPSGVVMCYSPRLMRHLIDEGGLEPHARVSQGVVYTVPGPDLPVGVVGGFGIGAPAAVVVLEELAALGASRFISMGAAGTLQRDVAIGDLVVCTEAIRDEGVSYHYLPAARASYPSGQLTDAVRSELSRRQLAFRDGPTWTIDAPYRETVDEAKHYQSEGVLTVEMEAAAIFAVAEVRKLHAASAFVVSDSLAELTWNPQFGNPAVVDGMRTLFSVCVAALGSGRD